MVTGCLPGFSTIKILVFLFHTQFVRNESLVQLTLKERGMKHQRMWTYDKITTLINTYLEETFQGYANLLKFCPLILASIRGSCLEQWLLWCSHDDFLFLFPSYIYYLELFFKGDLSHLCHLFIAAWIFFRLESHAIIYFIGQIVLTLSIWEPFQIGSCVLLTYSYFFVCSFVCFTFLLSAPGSPCISLAPVLVSAISP